MAAENESFFAEYIAQHIDIEWQRKASLETKSYSSLTANLAIATLYIALSNQRDLHVNLTKGIARDFLLAGLIAAVASIVAAVIAVAPRAYPGPKVDDLDQIRRKFRTRPPQQSDLIDEIIEAQLRDLRQARLSNDHRGRGLFASILLLGIELVALLISISLAAL
jgi:hypothetical protein